MRLEMEPGLRNDMNFNKEGGDRISIRSTYYLYCVVVKMTCKKLHVINLGKANHPSSHIFYSQMLSRRQLINPLRIDVPLNYLRNFRSHFTENTVRLLQKLQSLNGVEKIIAISSFDAINIVLMRMSCVLS